VRSPWGRVPISSQRMCTLRRASSTDGIGGSIIRQMSASRPNGCLTKADGLVVPAWHLILLYFSSTYLVLVKEWLEPGVGEPHPVVAWYLQR
jgi:hypothetical protein